VRFDPKRALDSIKAPLQKSKQTEIEKTKCSNMLARSTERVRSGKGKKKSSYCLEFAAFDLIDFKRDFSGSFSFHSFFIQACTQ
jgi:hypothetical protein